MINKINKINIHFRSNYLIYPDLKFIIILEETVHNNQTQKVSAFLKTTKL